MKGKIASDDLRPGKYIIVSEWYDETFKEEEKESGDPYSFFYRPRVEKPKKPVGVPFKVLAVALPFITLETLEPGRKDKRGVLDVRTVGMIEVDLAYVRSLIPEFKPTSSRVPANLTKDEREKAQIYFMKGGVWKEILKENP